MYFIVKDLDSNYKLDSVGSAIYHCFVNDTCID